MIRTCLTLAAYSLAAALTHQSLLAGPLTSAEVTKIINQVSVVDPQSGPRPAAVRDQIKNDLGLATGKKSRSELLFQDNTLTRLGAETFFSFKTGTRDLTLEKGSMLLQVPKGLGGARIHTAAVTAAITGTTIMMEHVPKQYIKVLVLEGSLRVSRNGRVGDSIILRPGKMLIMKPDAKRIPDPIDVDLATIVKTSSLVNFSGAEPLPSMDLIQAAIDHQQKQIASSSLAPTNLMIGHGTNVLVMPTTAFSDTGVLPTPTNASKVAAPSTAVLGGVVSNLDGTVGSTTNTVNNLVASTSAPVTGVTSDLLGAASTITAGPVDAIGTVVSSTTSALGPVTTDLLATTATVISIPVSSSSQLLSIVDTAVPTSGGVAMVVPTLTSTVATTTSSIAGSLPATTISATSSTAPAISATTSTLTSSATPLVSSAITTATSPTIATSSTITSAPTTLVSATSITQSSTSTSSPTLLGLGGR